MTSHYDHSWDGKFKPLKCWKSICGWWCGEKLNQFWDNIVAKQCKDGSEVPRWFILWNNCLDKRYAFVTSKDGDTLEVAVTLSTLKKKPFIWLEKEVRVSIVLLERLTTRTRIKRRFPLEDLVQPTSQNRPKEKQLWHSPRKQKKKNKEAQPRKVIEKKRKLLSGASSVAKTAKVYLSFFPNFESRFNHEHLQSPRLNFNYTFL